MIDQDVLRKAVELADGWEWREYSNNGVDIFYPFYGGSFKVFTAQCMPENRVLLDALAAQLVRQVESCGRYYVAQYGDGRTAVLQYSGGQMLAVSIRPKSGDAKDADRTENTINAIVKSGVLKK